MAGCEYNPDPFGTGLLMEHLSDKSKNFFKNTPNGIVLYLSSYLCFVISEVWPRKICSISESCLTHR